MTKISAEDVVALMDADWHWKPEHKALVRALEAVRVAIGAMNGHAWDCDLTTWRRVTGMVGPAPDCNCGFSGVLTALAAVDRIEKGEV